MADDTLEKAGLYERAVQWITERVKPYLHSVTEHFVKKSVNVYAKDNDHFARMIEFEVRRRGDGAGLTQDVAEPMVWVGIKTAIALPIAVLSHSLEKGKFKLIGYGAALGLILNNTVELLRVLPRYKAGLQGSLEMAKDRWKSLEETGVDPFNSQTREINKRDLPKSHENTQRTASKTFAKGISTNGITPAAILENKEKTSDISRC